MSRLTINSKVPQILSEIVSFVNDNIDSNQFESITKRFVHNKITEINRHKEEKDKMVNILTDFSFYSLSLYDLGGITSTDLFKRIMNFSYVKGELLEALTQESDDKKYANYGKLERKVSPPISAFKYIGNNKTDIKYSDISYGLLFE
jgi:hypothetical protein